MPTKTCNICHQDKDVSEFYARSASKDGLQGRCKECHTVLQRARTAEQAGTKPTPYRKLCRMCGKTKVTSSGFFKNRHQPDGLAAYCKPCWTNYTKARTDPVEKAEYQRGWWLRRFGLTQDDYDRMLTEQGSHCAICPNTEADSTGRRLAVDHDATTGRVRGLLCTRCNQGIGRFDHDEELLMSAFRYLQQT